MIVSDGLKEGSSRKFSSTVKATFESGFNNFVYSSTTFLLNVFISFTFFYEKRVFMFFVLWVNLFYICGGVGCKFG